MSLDALGERYPQVEAVLETDCIVRGPAEQLDAWSHLVAVAAVGTAFATIDVDFDYGDQQPMCDAVEAALDEWHAEGVARGTRSVLPWAARPREQMADYLSYTQQAASADEVAYRVGVWVWSNLLNVRTSRNVPLSAEVLMATGSVIAEPFCTWWRQGSGKC